MTEIIATIRIGGNLHRVQARPGMAGLPQRYQCRQNRRDTVAAGADKMTGDLLRGNRSLLGR